MVIPNFDFQEVLRDLECRLIVIFNIVKQSVNKVEVEIEVEVESA